jgi:hypothetical protein
MKYKITGMILVFLLTSFQIVHAQNIQQMEFKNQSIQDILMVLAQFSGTSIVTDETVTGNASFFFSEVDIKTALGSFLSAYRLYMREENGIIYVSKIQVSRETQDNTISVHAEDIETPLILRAISRTISKTVVFDPLPRDTITIHAEKVSPLRAVQIAMSRFPTYLAIKEYNSNHRVDTLTERLNAYYNTHKAVIGEDIQQSQYKLFSREDW